ncbi:sporulation initiation phosphotransferase Spo0F [soil metagenome]
MRKLLEAELRADGYVVFAVGDGTEVLEALSDMSGLPLSVPDIIVMDVRMPGCSGIHILAALRAAHCSTPVILITAFGDARLHEEATRLGAAVVFDKPFDLDDLRTALLHVLGDEARSPKREHASDSDMGTSPKKSKPEREEPK